MIQGSITVTLAFSQEDTGSLFVRPVHYSVLSVWEDVSFADESICQAECQGWHILEICLEKTLGCGSVRSQKDRTSYI